MVTRTQAISNFLKASTHPDLSILYNYNMEVQVNVAEDGGTRVDGDFKGRQWHGWTDGFQTWKSFRIPYKANTEPEYEDRPISFDLAAHVEGIGLTGWDWVNKCSRWVAFDFDAISGHSDKHERKLSDTELKDVQTRVMDVPWVTIRRSTSGKGLHLYVFLEGIKTENHTEHAALARAILGMMSAQARTDFQAKVDAVGGNMWVFHRKMRGTDGLQIIKSGGVFTEVPPNWRDHIQVVSNKRRKILPNFIQDQGSSDLEKTFDELSGQRTKIPLDEDHHKLINWLRENNCHAWWDSDHWMLVTHTMHLRQAHHHFQFKGFFETKSDGTDLNTQNAFAFPMRRGAWTVRRYTPGIEEHNSWTQDGQGWTTIAYNKEPDLANSARANTGVEHPTKGFMFREAEMAQSAIKALGAKVELPNRFLNRRAYVKEHKDGRIIMEFERQPDDPPEHMDGWIPEDKSWKRIFNVHASDPYETDIGKFDDIVRHLVSEDGKDCDWVIRSDNVWRDEPLVHVKAYLEALGYSPKECKTIIGSSVFKPWTLVNRPFQPEIPGDRQWNRGAAQFRYTPTLNKDDLRFDTWMRVLNHCGSGLDNAVKEHPWCKSNGILTGGDYLKCWVASMFQYPLEPLPYLFFYGPQNSGKSTFHEALTILVTHGVVRAQSALTSDFNGELANAILCVVEEMNLRKDKKAADRIKDYVTSRQISIHAKNKTPYMIPNATHWAHFANEHLACPIFPGDTRITMSFVDLPPSDKIIPKKQLMILLEKEAPDFLSEIISLEIPPSPDRLNIPVITTDEKLLVEKANRTLLETFIEENVHFTTGKLIKFSDFYDRFKGWLEDGDKDYWTKHKVGREMPTKFTKGRLYKQGSSHYIGNMSWFARTPDEPILPKIVVKNERLFIEGTNTEPEVE